VYEVNFGVSSKDANRYKDVQSEMWFDFPIDEADIPNDTDLMRELSGRRYDYDKEGRKQIEPKDKYKARNGGKSPDKADALLLCFYEPHGRVTMSAETHAQMKARRARR